MTVEILPSKGGFERVQPLGQGHIRGPARLLWAPYAWKFPNEIGEIINLGKSAEYKNCKQKIEKTEATEGSFYLGFGGYHTTELKFNETGENIIKALEALPTIGTGGVKIISEPTKKISETKFEFEFFGELKNHAQPLIEVLRNTTKKVINPAYSEEGYGEYDPVTNAQGEGWHDLGASKGGIKITRNNTESLQDVDQIQAAVAALPDQWEMSVEAPLAETTPEHLEVSWEGEAGANISPANAENPIEKQFGMGNPLEYTERRLAVIYKGTLGTNQGKLKAFVFRRVTRSAVASTVDFMKTGNMATVNTTFRCFADGAVANPKFSMGTIISQNYF